MQVLTLVDNPRDQVAPFICCVLAKDKNTVKRLNMVCYYTLICWLATSLREAKKKSQFQTEKKITENHSIIFLKKVQKYIDNKEKCGEPWLPTSWRGMVLKKIDQPFWEKTPKRRMVFSWRLWAIGASVIYMQKRTRIRVCTHACDRMIATLLICEPLFSLWIYGVIYVCRRSYPTRSLTHVGKSGANLRSGQNMVRNTQNPNLFTSPTFLPEK